MMRHCMESKKMPTQCGQFLCHIIDDEVPFKRICQRGHIIFIASMIEGTKNCCCGNDNIISSMQAPLSSSSYSYPTTDINVRWYTGCEQQHTNTGTIIIYIGMVITSSHCKTLLLVINTASYMIKTADIMI